MKGGYLPVISAFPIHAFLLSYMQQKEHAVIFPIGDDQVEGGSVPFVSYSLILLNCIVFAFEITLSDPQLNNLIMTYGSIPGEIAAGKDLYTLLTSMFLHGGWMHLIGNMLFLWVFADNIEAIIGNIKFLLFYLAGGIAASLVHLAFNMGSMVPAIGASGAISAVLGAYLLMFPSSRVRVFIIYIFGSIRIPAMFFLGIWIIQQLFNGIFALDPTARESAGVAWWAHIGGFAFGVVVGLLVRRSQKSRPKTYSRDMV